MQIQIQTQTHPFKELAEHVFCDKEDDHLAMVARENRFLIRIGNVKKVSADLAFGFN